MVLSDRFLPLTWVRKINIAQEIVKGMQHLHSRRLIHRDLKSENILVGFTWEIKIIDFCCTCFTRKTPLKDSMIGTAGMNIFCKNSKFPNIYF